MRRDRISPEVRARVVALRDADVPATERSWRKIEEILAAEGVRLSYVGARAVYLDEKSKGGAGGEEQGEDGGEDEGGAGEVPPPVRGTVRAPDEVPLPELPKGATVAAQVLYAQLKDTRERLRRLPQGVESATEYASLARVALQQLNRLEQMLPPAAVEAKRVARNAGAREAVHAHVLQVVEAAEARAGALCPRCFKEVRKR